MSVFINVFVSAAA